MKKPSPFIEVPDRLVMEVPGLSEDETDALGAYAVEMAQRYAPKLTGASSARMVAISGEGWFGVQWFDPQIWFQEHGIRSFTMRKLAGKVIPMWIDDPTGKVRKENPKARTRTTKSGKVQVQIFRRAAKMGQRRTEVRAGVPVDVPASYPGAPGRIAVREAGKPWTSIGRVGGRIAPGNVGVRWRHPGLLGRSFIYRALVQTAFIHHVEPGEIHAYRGAA